MKKRFYTKTLAVLSFLICTSSLYSQISSDSLNPTAIVIDSNCSSTSINTFKSNEPQGYIKFITTTGYLNINVDNDTSVYDVPIKHIKLYHQTQAGLQLELDHDYSVEYLDEIELYGLSIGDEYLIVLVRDQFKSCQGCEKNNQTFGLCLKAAPPTVYCIGNDPSNPCAMVCNGGFENLDECPECISNIGDAIDFSRPFYHDVLLNAPIPNSPDLFTPASSNCYSTSSCPTVGNNPGCYSGNIISWDNSMGTQTPYGGNNYSGFIAYSSSALNSPERIHGRMKEPMVAGETYYVRFYVSLADYSEYAIEDVGLHFFTGYHPANYPNQDLTSYNGQLYHSFTSSNGLSPVVPAVVNVSGAIVDTQGWVEISGTYVAQGGEDQYIITNYNDRYDSDAIYLGDNSICDEFAYYYVDGIAVSKQPFDIDVELVDCSQNGFTLTAESGFDTYIWSTGETTQSIVVNPLSIQNYTVNGTINGLDCGVMGEITVKPMVNPQGDIVGPEYTCDGHFFTSSNYNSDNIYTWSVSGNATGFPSSNGSYAVNFLDPNSDYTVSLNVINPQGCEFNYTFEVEACCEVLPADYGFTAIDPDFDTDYSNPTLISSIISASGSSVYTSPNDAILINNDLIIDQDFTFNNCPYIFVIADAKIIVEPGITLSLGFNTTIRPKCDVPWEGITVTDPTAQVYINRATLIGANKAIYSNNGGQYNIITSDFYNNDIAVHMENTISSSSNNISGTTIGTNVSEPDVFGARPSYGVLINEVVNLTIGTNNLFFDMDYGVHITNANVVCNKNTFEDITTSNTAGTTDGIAIFAQTKKGFPGYLLTAGTQNNTKNKITNCHVGIMTQSKMSLLARYNRMSAINFAGVITRKTDGTTITLERNNIKLANGFTVGIYLWGITNVNANIFANRVNLTALNAQSATVAGIAISQVSFSSSNNVIVESNLVRQCGYGIYNNNVPNTIIKKNTVQYFDYNNVTSNFYGIYVAGGAFTEIENNNVSRIVGQPSNSDPDLNLVGIHAENSPEVLIINNTVNKFGKGIQAKGNNSSSGMYCNKLNRTYNGVFLDNASTGDQGGLDNGIVYDQDNRWFQNISANKINGIGANMNNTWYYRNGNQYNIGVGNFNPVANIVPVLINSASYCPTKPIVIGPKSQRRGKLFDKIVYDQKNYTSYDSTLKFLDDTYAMLAFDYDSTWLTVGDTSDASYQSYFTTKGAGNFGKICGVTRAFENEDYTALTNENSGLNTAICNNSLGLKDVNSIYVSTWANEDFEYDAIQQMRLEELACSDALDNGPAVYAARTLLGWHFQCANNYQKSAETDNSNEKPIQTEAIVLKEGVEFTIYPNPSAGEVYLSYDLGSNKNATLKVYDLSGKLVHSELLNSEVFLIQLPNGLLNSGVYLYHVENGKEMLGTGKFIIN